MPHQIHDYPDAALAQMCYAVPTGDGSDWDAGEHITDMTGVAASRAVEDALASGFAPLLVDGEIMGYFDESGAGIIFCDCDEQTYEEYYGEPYQG